MVSVAAASWLRAAVITRGGSTMPSSGARLAVLAAAAVDDPAGGAADRVRYAITTAGGESTAIALEGRWITRRG